MPAVKDAGLNPVDIS